MSDSKAPGVPPDDVAAHIIATVADVYGVLFRAMSQGLKERPLETLSAGDVLLRYWSYERQPEVAEHALLRTRLEQLVDTQPYLADAWAALGDLYYQEFAHGFNPLPDSLARAHQAVRRALDLDAVHHHAWHVRAVTCYFDRDRDGFEHAAERALALNPHDTNTTAFLAFLWSQLGETDRACEMTARAMALNPAYPGWYHFVFFDRHYMRGEFAEALAQARKINMAQNLWSPWAVAVSAGQLARATDARAALDALLTLAPAFKQESVLREAIVRWRWNQPANVDLAMDGFRKAKALTGSDVAAPDLAAKPPARTPDSAAGLAADAFVVTVIPFAAAAGGDAAELADGLTQGTAVGLSRFSYLRAVTRNVTADSITTGYVLTGSVRMAGGVVRVVVQLTAAATGQNLWAETYDRKSGAGLAVRVAGRDCREDRCDDCRRQRRTRAGDRDGRASTASRVADAVRSRPARPRVHRADVTGRARGADPGARARRGTRAQLCRRVGGARLHLLGGAGAKLQRASGDARARAGGGAAGAGAGPVESAGLFRAVPRRLLHPRHVDVPGRRRSA